MAKCGEGTAEILQVVACDRAFQAAFLVNDEIETVPVACWFLVDHDGDRHLHPAVVMGDEVGDATLAGNYLGVISPGETVVAGVPGG